MTAIILTRTSNRPKMFARLKRSIRDQDFTGRVFHIVYCDDPKDSYATGDLVIRGKRASGGTAPWETYHNEMLAEAVRLFSGQDAFVLFVDDDDMFARHDAISQIFKHVRPGAMPVWKVEREKGRISPFVWKGDLTQDEGRICWEAAALHIDDVDLSVRIDANDGADGRFWATMAKRLKVEWVDMVMTKPQVGKGHGRRRDA